MAKLDMFWIVVDPTERSEVGEICYRTTAAELDRNIRGCVATGSELKGLAVHSDVNSAVEDASARVMALRDRAVDALHALADLKRETWS